MQANLLGSERGADRSEPSAINAAFGAGGAASDLFTKLLVAQIRNQNPLEPTDPSEFVNQLTQLSQMESLQALSKQAATSSSMMQSLQVLALGAQVGSKVTVRSDTVTLGSLPVSGSFTLDGASEETALVLTNAAGIEHAIALGTQRPGDVRFNIDPAALGLTPGVYTLRAETSGARAAPVQIESELASVKLSASGGVTLNVSHVGEVAAESITQFNGRP